MVHRSLHDFRFLEGTVDRLSGFHNAILETQQEGRAGLGPAVVADATTDACSYGPGAWPANGPRAVVRDRRPHRARRALADQGSIRFGQEHVISRHRRHLAVRQGKVGLPREFRALFLPQRPYFPLGTLRQVVSYPAPAEALPTQRCAMRFR